MERLDKATVGEGLARTAALRRELVLRSNDTHETESSLATIERYLEDPRLSSDALLDEARSLLADQGVDAALAAWVCLNWFPACSEQARSVLQSANALLPGMLLPFHVVAVSSRAIALGGSWLNDPNQPQALPTAWDIHTIARFAELLQAREATCYLDVGANSGSFALLGSVNPGLRCFAIEPNPSVADLLEVHITANGLISSVSAHVCALSDHNGSTVLGVPTQTGRATIGDASHLLNHSEITVETLTLDAFVTANSIERVDAIKIDTEGHELPILRGGESSIAAFRPMILLESVDTMMARHGYSRHDLMDFFRRHKYSARPIGSEDLLAMPG